MWKRSVWLVVGLILAGCGAQSFETAKVPPSSSSTAMTAAATASVDIRGELPEASDRGRTGGIVALRLPAQRVEVEPVLAKYFRAITREDLTALGELFVRGAQSGSGSLLLDSWRSRFQSSVFQRMSGREIAVFNEMNIRSFGGGRETLPGAEGDLVVTVPLEASSGSGDPLFGASCVFLLRYEGRALKIAYAAEDVVK